jgi:hypothetical protein
VNALTLWPEWPWAIDLPNEDGTGYHPLAKRVENREWEIPIGQWIALHAGKYIGGRKGRVATDEGLDSVALMGQRAGFETLVRDEWKDGGVVVLRPFLGTWGSCNENGIVPPNSIRRPIVTSAIIGLFRVTRYVGPGDNRPLPDGVRGWKVSDAVGNVFEYKRLNKPVSCDGHQKLWTLPDNILARCREVGTEKAI